MRILVTGSRAFTQPQIVWSALDDVLSKHGTFTLVVGDCPTGADAFARTWGGRHWVITEVHKADWRTHGRAAGPLRNKAMVDAGADLVLAFPLGRSAGTRGCMRLAAAAGIPVKEHTP